MSMLTHFWRTYFNNGWLFTVLLMAILISAPICYIAFQLFSPSSEIWSHIVETLLLDYVVSTLKLCMGVAFFTLLLGLPSAWLVSTCKFPLRQLLSWALVLPLAIPAYINAAVYKAIFGSPIMNMYGAVLVMSAVLYPYIYLISRNIFERQSQSVLEVSEMLGKNRWQTFFNLVLPLSRPAVVGGLFLVMMEVLNEYGAVKYYGINTFTKGIFRAWFSFNDVGAAVRLSALLMVFVFIFVGLEYSQRRQKRFYDSAFSPKPVKRIVLKGIKSWLVFLVCLLPVFVGFLLPVSQLVYWAITVWAETNLVNIFELIYNSTLIAWLSALVVSLFAIIIYYSVRISNQPVTSFFLQISNLGYAIPGAVIAIGSMVTLISFDNFLSSFIAQKQGFWLNATFSGLTYAYLVRFLAVGANPIETGWQKISKNIDYAAQMSGRRRIMNLFLLHLPMMKGSIAVCVLLVFVDTLKELPLTLILRPFNFDTLATKAFELADDERFASSGITALLIVGVGLMPTFLLNKLIKEK
jgi:iron(III) transport system permease protein